MPAMLDDPTGPTIYRTSGAPPYPTPTSPLPPTIAPRQVTLRDRITIATLLPFSSASQVPPTLLAYLCDQLNREIEKGDTYPMIALMTLASFGPYWFQNFGAVMLLGELEGIDELQEGTDWEKVCLGSFYVKPNYPGRSSHVCNGGFLVTDAARNRGVGRLMGEGYLEWAPKLGYTYSVFNLVYETNLASCRIWDALGFKRIGRVKGCGALRSHPNDLIDAIIYGRDLGPDGEDFVSEERFDKIRFYLKHGKYPAGADRAEKSRLRSAATHYKLLPASGEEREGGEKLMLKDKEVVADPQRQYEIARVVHMQQHGGINKTTATIAEQFHWVRIKETVSLVIKNCPDCKEVNKPPSTRPDPAAPKRTNPPGSVIADIERLVDFDPHPTPANPGPGVAAPPPPTPQAALPPPRTHIQQHPAPRRAPVAHMQSLPAYDDMPLDPQIMQDLHPHSPHPLFPLQHLHHHAHPDPVTAGARGRGCEPGGLAPGRDFDVAMADATLHHQILPPDTRLATEDHIRRHGRPRGFQAGAGSEGVGEVRGGGEGGGGGGSRGVGAGCGGVDVDGLGDADAEDDDDVGMDGEGSGEAPAFA